MQDNIQYVLISYWFKKIEYNPKEKIDALTDYIKSIIDTPLRYNTEDASRFFSMPRIEGISVDKKKIFSMSLINATLRFDVKDLDNDEIILLVNNYSQLFYDLLKEVYNIDIIYTCIYSVNKFSYNFSKILFISVDNFVYRLSVTSFTKRSLSEVIIFLGALSSSNS